MRKESKIQGNWPATGEGYDLELKIPINMLNHQFSIIVADVDSEATRTVKYLMGNGNIDEPGSLQLPSKKLKSLLSEFDFGKMSIFDRHQRLIAERGDVMKNTDPLMAMYQSQSENPNLITIFSEEGRGYVTTVLPLHQEEKLIGFLKIEQSRTGLNLILMKAKSNLVSITL